MKEKLHKVLTGSGVGSKTVESFTKKTEPEYSEKAVTLETEGDDDTLSYLSKLADED